MRLQTTISKTIEAKVDYLINTRDLESHRELIANAICLFEWAARQLDEGWRVGAFNETEKQYKEIEMPALQRRVISKPAEQAESVQRAAAATAR